MQSTNTNQSVQLTPLSILKIGRVKEDPTYTFMNYILTVNERGLPPSRLYTPINYLGEANFEGIDKYNEIVKYLNELVPPSLFTSEDVFNSRHFNYRWGSILEKGYGFTIYVLSNEAQFGIRLATRTNIGQTNGIGGVESAIKFIKLCRENNIDLHKYATNDTRPLDIPVETKLYADPYVMYKNCHHIDLNSAHLSGILNAYPEFKPICEYMYNNRHTDSDKWKMIINSFIGALYSDKWCPNIDNLKSFKSRQLKELYRVAKQYCYDKTRELMTKLEESGRRIILTNTDGIWYQGDIYHDEDEGVNLCQYKNDHINCEFLTSKNTAYQFKENGVVYTKAKGQSRYERDVKNRSEWEFGELIQAQDYDPDEEESELTLNDKGEIVWAEQNIN